MITHIDWNDIPENHPVFLVNLEWVRMADDTGVPRWSNFDPIEHPRILPWVLLLKPIEDGRFLYLICGEGCATIFGFSYAGKLFGEGLPPEAVADRQVEFQTTITSKKPLFSKTALPIEGREFINVYRGVFPFYDENGEFSRMMVIIAPADSTV